MTYKYVVVRRGINQILAGFNSLSEATSWAYKLNLEANKQVYHQVVAADQVWRYPFRKPEAKAILARLRDIFI
jgi:hypothetical protein